MAVEDVPSLFAWYLEDPPALCRDKTFEIDWLYKVQADESQWRYSIRADGELAGLATLWWNKSVPNTLSPTILVAPRWRNRGVGTLALITLVDVVAGSMPNVSLLGQVNDDNPASLRMAEKVFGPGTHDGDKVSFLMTFRQEVTP
jgi:RimJ/RimL family protein N-acetyltransferase